MGALGAAVGALVGGIAGANARRIAGSKPVQKFMSEESPQQAVGNLTAKKAPAKKASAKKGTAKKGAAKKPAAGRKKK